jgi:hypothetical protein
MLGHPGQHWIQGRGFLFIGLFSHFLPSSAFAGVLDSFTMLSASRSFNVLHDHCPSPPATALLRCVRCATALLCLVLYLLLTATIRLNMLLSYLVYTTYTKALQLISHTAFAEGFQYSKLYSLLTPHSFR